MTDKKNDVIRFRVTESERKEIEERAIGNVSSWIRDLALDQPIKKKPKPVNFKLLYELNKIGVNLNQISRYLNSNKSGLSSVEKAEFLITFISIDEQLKEIREKYDS